MAAALRPRSFVPRALRPARHAWVLLASWAAVGVSTGTASASPPGSTITVVAVRTTPQKKTRAVENQRHAVQEAAVASEAHPAPASTLVRPPASQPVLRLAPASTIAKAQTQERSEIVATDAIAADSSPRVLPWVTLGGSVALGALGGFFAAKTGQALGRDPAGDVQVMPDGKVELPEELRRQQAEVFENGLAATLLLSTAAAGAVSSVILLLSD